MLVLNITIMMYMEKKQDVKVWIWTEVISCSDTVFCRETSFVWSVVYSEGSITFADLNLCSQ